jgi:hypothetical protein
MPGRVWIGGCVQVVQNINIIPNCLHPRSKLSDALVEHVGEVVYITVYDPERPHVGPVAVLEALFACKSTDSMMVANFISFVGSTLLQMKVGQNEFARLVRVVFLAERLHTGTLVVK